MQALDRVFERPRPAKLGIVLGSGALLVAPVWVGRNGSDLVFNADRETVEGRGQARDPRVALCFDAETRR